MFNVGDKKIYPARGTVEIIGIEDIEIFDEKKTCYLMKVMITGLTITVPVDSCEQIGVRDVIDKSEIPEMLDLLQSNAQEQPKKQYAARMSLNTKKINTGGIVDLVEVVRDLHNHGEKKVFSLKEKIMYLEAKQILCSEIMASDDLTSEEAEKMVNDKLAIHGKINL